MHHNHTISIHFVNAILRSVDSEAVMRGAIQRGALSVALLMSPRARILPFQLSSVIKSIAKDMNDEFLGLSENALPMGSFLLLARNAIHSQNLYEIYKSTARALKVMTTQLSLELIEGDRFTRVRFHIKAKDGNASVILCELALLIWHRFPSWLIGERVHLEQVRLPFKAPTHANEYPLLFGGKIEYNCEFAELVIPNTLLKSPCRRSLQELNGYVSELPKLWFQYMDYGSRSIDISGACLNAMQMLDSTSMHKVAKSLNTSIRTLSRKLAAENVTFQKLKAVYLRDKALNLLANDQLSIEQITSVLGYTEPSAFTRAFKQWTGNTPHHYRKMVRK